MKKEKMSNKKKIIIVIAIVVGVALIAGATYALWQIDWQQESKNKISGMCFSTSFSGENSITLNDAVPISDERGMQEGPYTFTITNNCSELASYQINLEVLETSTLSSDYVKIALDETKAILGSYEESVTTLDDAIEGRKLQTGYLEPNQSKTFSLRLWLDYATTTEQGSNKTLLSKITVVTAASLDLETTTFCQRQGITNLKDCILASNGGASAITAKGNPTFTKSAVSQEYYDNLSDKTNYVVENGMWSTADDYGTSYYYRGSKELLNNNVIFGGFQWKVIRINGDGSIRMIYNGTCQNNECTINSTGESTQIENNYYNINYGTNRYVGYMVGSADTNYTTSHNNSTNSLAKTRIDDWYEININNETQNKLANVIYCNDRQLHSGTGAGTVDTFYKGYNRLMDNKNPILKCNQPNDQFTLIGSDHGNKLLRYPVALITADEAAMAGLLSQKANSNNYLYTEVSYWTMTASHFALSGGMGVKTSYIFRVHESLGLGNTSPGAMEIGIRPVINLKSDVSISSGDGTMSNPFIVE